VHRASLTPIDIIQLKLYGRGYLDQSLLDSLTVPDTPMDVDSQEKLALLGENGTNSQKWLGVYEEIEKDCNVLEVIEGLLRERGITYMKN
jgi:hypothetical protein